MPSRTENSEHPSTLPPEDLNPLVNPLLAQNMGRWAEVYFTSLPENRDQAVTDLLSELQEEAAAAKAPAPADAAAASHASAPNNEDLSALMLRCPECGHENRTDHNFCGACRAQLRGEAGAYPHLDPYVDRALPDSPFVAPRSDARVGTAFRASHPKSSSALESEDAAQTSFENRRRNDGLNNDGLNSDRLNHDYQKNDRQRNDGADLFRFSTAAPAPRYRLYAGIVIAVVILFLLYRGWSSGHLGAGTSHSVPQLPPAAAQTSESSNGAAAPASTTQASTAPTANSSHVESANAQSTYTAAQPDSGRGKAALNASSKTGAGAQIAPSETQPSAKSSAGTPTGTAATGAAQLSSDNGSAELALAKNYLAGADGKPRESAQAAALLWKSVAKQNAEATELLGDLYLKGDGVSQNCDQGRLLLDAAARKGRKAAGERLGHLQAFGCQ